MCRIIAFFLIGIVIGTGSVSASSDNTHFSLAPQTPFNPAVSASPDDNDPDIEDIISSFADENPKAGELLDIVFEDKGKLAYLSFLAAKALNLQLSKYTLEEWINEYDNEKKSEGGIFTGLKIAKIEEGKEKGRIISFSVSIKKEEEIKYQIDFYISDDSSLCDIAFPLNDGGYICVSVKNEKAGKVERMFMEFGMIDHRINNFLTGSQGLLTLKREIEEEKDIRREEVISKIQKAKTMIGGIASKIELMYNSGNFIDENDIDEINRLIMDVEKELVFFENIDDMQFFIEGAKEFVKFLKARMETVIHGVNIEVFDAGFVRINDLNIIALQLKNKQYKKVKNNIEGLEKLNGLNLYGYKDGFEFVIKNIMRNIRDHGGYEEKGDTIEKRIDVARRDDNYYIEISDNGQGFNVETLREKAVELGFFSKEKARAASEEEIINLIFRKGFSRRYEDGKMHGMGLWLCRNTIKDDFGGTISAENMRDEEDNICGAKFILTIPVPKDIERIPKKHKCAQVYRKDDIPEDKKRQVVEEEMKYLILLKDDMKPCDAEDTSQKPIVLLGTSWIKGYDRYDPERYDPLNKLITSVRRFCYRQGMPLEIVEDSGLSNLARKTKENNPKRKIIVLGGKETVISSEFDAVRNDKNILLAGVNNEELTEESYFNIVKILRIVVKLISKKHIISTDDQMDIKFENGCYILIPKAEPLKDKLKQRIYYELTSA